MSGTSQGYISVPEFEPNGDDHRRKLARAVNNLLQGKLNCTLDVTLASSTTVTTITDPRIGFYTAVEAGCALSSPAKEIIKQGIFYSNFAKGSVVANHTTNSTSNSTIRFLILG